MKVCLADALVLEEREEEVEEEEEQEELEIGLESLTKKHGVQKVWMPLPECRSRVKTLRRKKRIDKDSGERSRL